MEWLLRTGALPAGARVLSPSPLVLASAHDRGLEPMSAHRYLGPAAHRRIVLAADGIERALREAAGPLSDSLGVSEAYADGYFFYVRQFLAYLLYTVESLGEACEVLAPSRIVVTALVPRQFTNDLGRQTAEDAGGSLFAWERYGADVAAQVGRACGVDCQVVSQPASVRADRRWTSRRVARRVLTPLVLTRLRREVSRIQADGAELVLAPSPTYGLDRVLDRLREGRPPRRVIYLVGARHLTLRSLLAFLLTGRQSSPALAWANVVAAPRGGDQRFDQEVRAFLARIGWALDTRSTVWTYRGVNLAPLVRERALGPLAMWLRNLHRHAAVIDRLLTVLRPAHIVSQMSLGFSAALGELGRVRRIPALLVSHGSHVPRTDDCERMVWARHAVQLTSSVYAHQAIQTPWGERFLQQVPTRSETHRTGPLLLTRAAPSAASKALRAELAPHGEAIVLHAGSPKGRSAARPYVYETPDEYVANLRDLVEAIERTPGAILIIRFRPSEGLSAGTLGLLLPRSSRTYIRGDGVFGGFLAAADLVVSFSSTAIEEALLSHRRVLQYDPTGRYCHIPAPAFDAAEQADRAVWFVDRRDRLAPALACILTHPRPAPDAMFAEHEFPPDQIVDLPTVLDRMSGRSST